MRVGWALVAVCLLAAVVLPPLLRAWDPEMAVLVSLNEAVDPWGSPWSRLDPTPRLQQGELYSFGPNLEDERGGGDDVRVFTASSARLLPGRRAYPVWVPLFYRCTEVALGLAFLLTWLLIGPYRRTPRGPLGVECLRSLALGGPSALLTSLGVYEWLRWWGYRIHAEQIGLPGLAIPVRVALVGAPVLLCLLGALAWRLSRPFEEHAA